MEGRLNPLKDGAPFQTYDDLEFVDVKIIKSQSP